MQRYSLLLLTAFSFALSCSNNKRPAPKQDIPEGILLKAAEVDYPSGSSLKFREGKLYVMGDDAANLLVLDTAFRELDRIPVFSSRTPRLPKSVKADIEAMDFVTDTKGNWQLLLLGSGSVSPSRDSLFTIDLANRLVQRFSATGFYRKIQASKLPELNIEGASLLKGELLLANRGNINNPQNYLITTPFSFPPFIGMSLKVIPLNIGAPSYGVSGLDYDSEDDRLFLTFSSEATESASADGQIGNSALAMILDVSEKLKDDKLGVDVWIPLADIDRRFDKMKIESVALGDRGDEGLTLYLTADNDDGKSFLFKIKLLLH